jgi:hypothetical protein
MKKVIRFTLNGEFFTVIAYYSIAHLADLVRPRSHIAIDQQLLRQGLNDEFFEQPAVVMTDDQNNGHVCEPLEWHDAPIVERSDYRRFGSQADS